jgi:hypothetical protein
MALPVTVPNTFAGATASIPLSQLDANFDTLSNAVNGIANGVESLANVQVTGGDIANVSVSDNLLSNSNRELVTVAANASTGTINFDVLSQQVLYFTANASADWTLNVRGDGSTALNDIMGNGESVTLTFLSTQGTTSYYANVYTIDSSSVTPLWQNDAEPTGGNPDSVDAYTLSIIKTANATYTVFASQTQFK